MGRQLFGRERQRRGERGASGEQLAAHLAPWLGAARLLIAGDAAATAATALAARPGVMVAADTPPDARGVAAAALGELRAGASASAVRPLYLRPADVTSPRLRQPGAATAG
jgi:tRNA A37 threonylcarbamoyladenosine modification protein TsaB